MNSSIQRPDTAKVERLMVTSLDPAAYPCLTLAERIDPLEIALECGKGSRPSLTEVYRIAKEKISQLLEQLPESNVSRVGDVDSRWYWAGLAILDRHFHSETFERWHQLKDGSFPWRHMIKGKSVADEDTGFAGHVDDFYELEWTLLWKKQRRRLLWKLAGLFH